MRSFARGEAARAVYERFETRLSAALGSGPVEWPAGFGVFTSRHGTTLEKPDPSLPGLAPEQALLVTEPIGALNLPSARVFARALETSFGPDARASADDDARGQLLVSALPPAWQQRWRRGFGLDPPAEPRDGPWPDRPGPAPPRVFGTAEPDALLPLLDTIVSGEAIPQELPPGVDRAEVVALVFAVTTLRWASDIATDSVDHRPHTRVA